MSKTKTRSAEPVLDHTVFHYIDKLSDYVNNSGSGVWTAPGAATSLMNMLESWKKKVVAAGSDPDESAFPTTLYAAQELQKFVNKQRSDIPNDNAARIFIRALRADVRELQNYEKDMDAE